MLVTKILSVSMTRDMVTAFFKTSKAFFTECFEHLSLTPKSVKIKTFLELALPSVKTLCGGRDPCLFLKTPLFLSNSQMHMTECS